MPDETPEIAIVTITLQRPEFELLLLGLGLAAGVASKEGSKEFAWAFLRLAGTIMEGCR